MTIAPAPAVNQLSAAEGWLMLDEYAEAAQELCALPVESRFSAEALRLWVLVYAGLEEWEQVQRAAQLCTSNSELARFGLRWLAEAAHQLGRHHEAIDAIRAGFEVEHEANCHLALARYLAAAGEVAEAKKEIRRGLELRPDLAEWVERDVAFQILRAER